MKARDQSALKRPGTTIDCIARLALLLTVLVAIGCQRQVAIRVDEQVPSALVERLPLAVGVHYPQSMLMHVYAEDSPQRGAWHIASGDSQVAMFRQVLGDLFDDVREVADTHDAGTALVLRPRLRTMQFATPTETGFGFFEAWVEYEIAISDAGGAALTPWRFSGYGRAPAERWGGLDDGLAAALGEALRNAGAHLATGLPRHAPVRDFLEREAP